MLDLVLRGGTIVTNRVSFVGDVGVKGDQIAGVWRGQAAPEAYETVDATGMIVMPGAIDAHFHTRTGEEFFANRADDMHTATVSAAMSGITTVIPFVFGDPGQPIVESLSTFFDMADQLSVVDYSAHCGLRADMWLINQIPDAFGLGINSFKMHMAYRRNQQSQMSDDDHRLAALELIGVRGGIGMFHCENGYIIDYLEQKFMAAGDRSMAAFKRSRPNVTEAEAVHRTIVLGDMAECPVYVVHLSSREGLAEIVAARAAGRAVSTETCPQYLTLTSDALDQFGPLAKIGPPLRSEEDVDALWKALINGQIGIIGSDHSARTRADKMSGGEDFFAAPFGTPTVEVMLPVVFYEGVKRGRISIEQFVSCFTENPARQFGLYPQKGVIQAGADADLVLWDPNASWAVDARDLTNPAGYSIFEGRRAQGRVIRSWLRGRSLVADGRVVAAPGSGQRAHRSTISSTSTEVG